MSKPLHVQIIPRARALIEDEDHWCRGGLARDKFGVSVLPTDSEARRRCAFGALIAAAHEATGDMRQAYEFAILAMGSTRGAAALVTVNDTEGHAAALALLDEAMAGS